MGGAAIAGRLVLAGVFGTAAAAKLADRDGSVRAMQDFGVPARVAPVAAVALAVVEITVAVSLLPGESAVWGAAGALALLLGFMGGIAANLARGRQPECHCFGGLHSSPAGWGTLSRNALLAAGAAFVLVEGLSSTPDSAFAWLGDLSPSGLVAVVGGAAIAAVVAAGAIAFVQLLRQHGRLLVRLDTLEDALVTHGIELPREPGPAVVREGLEPGEPAPLTNLRSTEGEWVTLESLVSGGRPLLLLFTDPGCGPCQALLPEVAHWQRDLRGALSVAVVSSGGAEGTRTHAEEAGLRTVLLDPDRGVAKAFEVAGTPSAVLVDGDGRIASTVAPGADAIRALVARARPAPMEVVQAGGGNGASPPPGLRDLSGRLIGLDEFRGNDTVLLFWNPSCGFCQQMLGELQDWERRRSSRDPELVLVSTGSVEANRAQGLDSRILLDEGFKTGSAFGAAGTPTAVLLDEQGKVASPPAVGPDAALDLIETGAPPGLR